MTKKLNAQTTVVYRFLHMLYIHGMQGTGHSWRRLNAALGQTLYAAVEGGMEFAESDYGQIFRDMKGSYWMGEAFYTRAIKVDNLSACKSYEAAVKMAPYELDGQRMFIGRDFDWNGERVTCTSMDKDSFVACSYKPGSDYPRKINRRYAIARQELETEAKNRSHAQADVKMQKAEQEAKAWASGNRIEKFLLDGCKARELAKDNLDNGHQRDRIIAIIDKRFGKRGDPTVFDLLAMGHRYEQDLGVIASVIATWQHQRKGAADIVRSRVAG